MSCSLLQNAMTIASDKLQFVAAAVKSIDKLKFIGHVHLDAVRLIARFSEVIAEASRCFLKRRAVAVRKS